MRLSHLPRQVAMGCIRAYQKTFSPDHGPLRFLFKTGYCRFHPTCSEYGYQSMQEHGLLKGTWLTIIRIIKCNPFHPGGIDEVPKNTR